MATTIFKDKLAYTIANKIHERYCCPLDENSQCDEPDSKECISAMIAVDTILEMLGLTNGTNQ